MLAGIAFGGYLLGSTAEKEVEKRTGRQPAQ
jgi:hypothetical protein